ncbi:MAG: helix-turn-helix domain-containing protein [Planctomycetes bacterium]|nr:helix-turn-helix domain-containing protein [Planctomycetota bacterium]
MSGQGSFSAAGFSRVPASVCQALPELSGSAAKLAIALCRYADGDGRCHPSVRTLMSDTGIKDTRTFNRARGELARVGLRWERNRRGPLRYAWGSCVEPLHTRGGAETPPAVCGTAAPVVCGTAAPAVCGTVAHRTAHEINPENSSRAAAAALLRAHFHLAEPEAERYAQQWPLDEIKGGLAVLAQRNGSGGVRNPFAYFLKLLREGCAADPATAAELRYRELAAFVRGGGASRVQIGAEPWRLGLSPDGRIMATHFTTGHERPLDWPEAESLLAPLMEQAARHESSDGEPPRPSPPPGAQTGGAGFSS